MIEGSKPPAVVVITGPTASGKGALAFELAQLLGGEIASLDSMKLYRELEVGTAKPRAERRALVRYHLIDVLEPHQSFSTGQYLPLLKACLEEIRGRGARPIVAGGTALYLKAFLDGFQAGPQADWAIRGRLFAEAERIGAAALHARLAAVDEAAARKIHQHDLRRIVRGLEAHEASGQPLSRDWSWQGTVAPGPDSRVFGLGWERAELHGRIDRRLDSMVAAGLFEEAARLRLRSPPLSRTAAQSIGYKEIWEGLDQGRSRAEIVDKLKQGTRRFAKSQMTWFRKLPVEWLSVSGEPDFRRLAAEIADRIA